MWRILGEIAVVAILAYFVADAFSIPFPFVAIGIAGLYLFTRGGHAPGGGGGGFFSAGYLISRSLAAFVVGVLVFVGLMMFATNFIGVSNSYATHEFANMGWRFWLWPQGFHRDFLLWTAVAFIMAGIATHASRGNWKVAGSIFVIAAIAIFVQHRAPNALEAVMIETAKPMPGATKGQRVEQAFIEKRGLTFAFCAAYELLWDDCGTTKKTAAATNNAAPSAPSVFNPVYVPTPAPTPVAHQPGGQSQFYRFGADGCVSFRVHGENVSFYPKVRNAGDNGWITIQPPGSYAPWKDAPGIKSDAAGRVIPIGEYTACRCEGSQATGLEISQ